MIRTKIVRKFDYRKIKGKSLAKITLILFFIFLIFQSTNIQAKTLSDYIFNLFFPNPKTLDLDPTIQLVPNMNITTNKAYEDTSAETSWTWNLATTEFTTTDYNGVNTTGGTWYYNNHRWLY